ncbi:MAG: phosphoribosylanthranilate isomerase [Desulfobacterales bacterium]|nr:phosphoribosylanthranilate isomerase [Desulfobacterales bacterium]
MNAIHHTRIKICGLTTPDEAIFCQKAGADAIGLVFFPKSPRHLSFEEARAISEALPEKFPKVGVFVNENEKNILKTVEAAKLTAVQLHGQETPVLTEKLLKQGLLVLKVFYMTAEPSIDNQPNYPGCTALVEWGEGALPGGNAMAWGDASKNLPRDEPLVIAGGLDPSNVSHTIQNHAPDGVDVSSGVETAPGRKDRDKIVQFIQAVADADSSLANPSPIKEPFSCPIQ